MSYIIMTKAQAVELHGSEDQKRHFAKYGKFTNKNLENALIDVLKRTYESFAKKLRKTGHTSTS
ncbi:hypothetical protein LHV56_12460 [Peribacillus frigoritolerans]|uniref:hypothetical protein n=1 Tax=Peribacillus frigoritolerans TaxID=450367 RepID=UPI00207A0EA2|nr:hypothetical protein [Peribacillus frigoritolerans]USK82632.1 hypothetical protein LHV56_12460 [Peribacillus frigoritolerans]